MATKKKTNVIDFLTNSGKATFVASWIEGESSNGTTFEISDLIKWANNPDSSRFDLAKRMLSNFECLIDLKENEYIEFDFSGSNSVYPGFIKRISDALVY